MFPAILITAVIGIIGVVFHRWTRLEKKVLKNIPLVDWMQLLVLPFGLYLCLMIMIRSILARPSYPIIPIDDFDLVAIIFFFIIMAYMGNAIHFPGKILWRYLREDTDSMIYKVNEIFHGKLSHYMAYFNALFVLFLMTILEVNHPMVTTLTSLNVYFIIIAGIIFGVSATKSIFYTNEWFGGYNKPLFFVTIVLLSILLSLFRLLKLPYTYYPYKLFITAVFASVVVSFIVRQVLIFTRLSKKSRLRFLAKILSA